MYKYVRACIVYSFAASSGPPRRSYTKEKKNY